MKHYGLIGAEISGSLSPAIHNHLFRQSGIDADYSLYPAPPDAPPSALSEILLAGSLVGANITAPFKDIATSLCDELDGAARRIGAVNTLLFREGIWRGHNSDVAGVTAAVDALVGSHEVGSVVVLGSGGAARAAASAMVDRRLQVFLVSRNPSSVRLFGLEREVAVSSYGSMPSADLIVSAVPSLAHGSDGTDLLPTSLLREARYLLDMSYVPRQTLLLRRASSCGLRVANGLVMLQAQALESFRLWTGVSVDESDLPEGLE